MTFTYILKCSDGSLYTGWTNDIEKRLKVHNSGKGAKYTRVRLPVELVYFESFQDKILAQKREAGIKKLSRKEKLKLIEGFDLEVKMEELSLNKDSREPIEDEIAKLLIKKGYKISTAESCTGGMIASMLINYPGISSVFMEGVVCYSNDSKMKRLGVKEETLKSFGAVSAETAEEMALGAASAYDTEVSISVTGIAGPGGGSVEKPVGLVYIGLYIDGRVMTRKFNFTGDRFTVRHSTAIAALEWLKSELNKTN